MPVMTPCLSACCHQTATQAYALEAECAREQAQHAGMLDRETAANACIGKQGSAPNLSLSTCAKGMQHLLMRPIGSFPMSTVSPSQKLRYPGSNSRTCFLKYPYPAQTVYSESRWQGPDTRPGSETWFTASTPGVGLSAVSLQVHAWQLAQVMDHAGMLRDMHACSADSQHQWA